MSNLQRYRVEEVANTEETVNGPVGWGGDGQRWDLWMLTKNETPGTGGSQLRRRALEIFKTL